MQNTTLLARMRTEGIDPALFSPEELTLVAKAAETGDFSFPPVPHCALPCRADLSAPVGQIAHTAQSCLDAVGPCSPIMQDTQRSAATAAAADLVRAFPGAREEILCLLREDEAGREALLTAVYTCRQRERCLICLHTAARISHRGEDIAATATALGQCEEGMQTLSAVLERLEGEMESLSALIEVYLPALLDAASPLFVPAPDIPFSAADFRAAALALRDACTKLINRKEEL